MVRTKRFIGKTTKQEWVKQHIKQRRQRNLRRPFPVLLLLLALNLHYNNPHTRLCVFLHATTRLRVRRLRAVPLLATVLGD